MMMMTLMLGGLLAWTAHAEHQEVWAVPSLSSIALKVGSLLSKVEYLDSMIRLNPFHQKVGLQVAEGVLDATCQKQGTPHARIKEVGCS
jgi:hypothetical protein